MRKADKQLFDLMTVDVPLGKVDGLLIDKFTSDARSLEYIYHKIQGRTIPPGTYTRMVDEKFKSKRGKNVVWMSDTPAERMEHMPFLRVVSYMQAERLIINGLGLGMVLRACLKMPSPTHIDVVERDWRVLRLVSGHYGTMARAAGKSLHFHHSDAVAMLRHWPEGETWDAGWSDIWPQKGNEDDLPEMEKLAAYYDEHCKWHDCWGMEEALQ